jgi:hypothetical protein
MQVDEPSTIKYLFATSWDMFMWDGCRSAMKGGVVGQGKVDGGVKAGGAAAMASMHGEWLRWPLTTIRP